MFYVRVTVITNQFIGLRSWIEGTVCSELRFFKMVILTGLAISESLVQSNLDKLMTMFNFKFASSRCGCSKDFASSELLI